MAVADRLTTLVCMFSPRGENGGSHVILGFIVIFEGQQRSFSSLTRWNKVGSQRWALLAVYSGDCLRGVQWREKKENRTTNKWRHHPKSVWCLSDDSLNSVVLLYSESSYCLQRELLFVWRLDSTCYVFNFGSSGSVNNGSISTERFWP